jgi:hypothetical protein
MMQVFPYQPLSPSANDMSSTLPKSEPILDYRMVNTMYQVYMIGFANRFSPNNATILADTVTKWQAWAFSNSSFYDRILWNSPLAISAGVVTLSSLSTADLANLKNFKVILLHYDGIAGPLSENARLRTTAIIDQAKNSWGNVVYDNGQSFIIADANRTGFG